MKLSIGSSKLLLTLMVQHNDIKCLIFKKNIIEHIYADNLCDIAAAIGDLRLLRYAHQHNFPWDKWTTTYAAKNGHLNCLKYVHEHGCDWSSTAICSAEWNHHQDCVDYCLRYLPMK